MATGATYNYDSNGRLINVAFNTGGMVTYNYDEMGNRNAVIESVGCTCPQYTIYAKSGNFTASDGSGAYYRISATASVTLPASPADGSVYKFKVTGGTSTFALDGAETINHANGVSDQSLVMTSSSGVLELIAVTGGWDET